MAEYYCPTCDAEFDDREPLMQHVNQTHEKTYDCPVCGAAFTTEDEMEEHQREIHAPVR